VSILWDSELAGFGLRVRAGGSKTFIAQYRAGGGRTGQTRRFRIGRYGTLTVDEARMEARKVLLAAAQGQDPAGKRRAKRGEMSISALIDLFEREGSPDGANPKAIAIMRLWALTGCRRDENAGLKWSEIDFARACLVLADSKMGWSMRLLARTVVAILQTQTRVVGSDFVFPSENDFDVFYQGTKRYWVRAINLAELPGVTPHTLRHTIESAAVSTGETLAMTGVLLGHANQQSTSIYAQEAN
jgi:integrase